MDRVFSFLFRPKCEVRGPWIPGRKKTRTEQTRLTRCLLYGFVDYYRKGTKSFDVLAGNQELEVRTATNRPEIEQSRHAKSVSHIINCITVHVLVTSTFCWSGVNPGFWKGQNYSFYVFQQITSYKISSTILCIFNIEYITLKYWEHKVVLKQCRVKGQEHAL